MAEISTYAQDATPSLTDRVLGTDSADGTTKNFSLDSISGLIGGASGDITVDSVTTPNIRITPASERTFNFDTQFWSNTTRSQQLFALDGAGREFLYLDNTGIPLLLLSDIATQTDEILSWTVGGTQDYIPTVFDLEANGSTFSFDFTNFALTNGNDFWVRNFIATGVDLRLFSLQLDSDTAGSPVLTAFVTWLNTNAVGNTVSVTLTYTPLTIPDLNISNLPTVAQSGGGLWNNNGALNVGDGAGALPSFVNPGASLIGIVTVTSGQSNTFASPVSPVVLVNDFFVFDGVVRTIGSIAVGLHFFTPALTRDLVAGDVLEIQRSDTSLNFDVGHGITFGDAITPLDDYEEGTWVPELINGPTPTNVDASYQKIGNTVTLFAEFTATSTSTNTIDIRGLPFAFVATSIRYLGYAQTAAGIGFSKVLQAFTGGPTQRIQLGRVNGDIAETYDATNNFIRIQLTYQTTA